MAAGDEGIIMNQGKEFDTVLRITGDKGEAVRANVSDNTLKAYEHAALKLEAWLEGRTLSDTLLAEYIRCLHAQGKSLATINLVVAAVKWMAAHHGLNNVVGDVTVQTVSSIRAGRKGHKRRQADPLRWDEVERVCTAAESSNTAAGSRDSAMISLMSDCLLRISEAVAVNVEHIQPDGLLIGGSEGTQDETLYICESTRQRIEHYRRRAGIKSGALFRRIRYQHHVTADRLGVKGARDAIRRWAAKAGVEGAISGQSLRIGSALSLAEAGATVKEMQQAGRWQDPTMPVRYVKEAPAEQSPVQRYKNGK